MFSISKIKSQWQAQVIAYERLDHIIWVKIWPLYN